MLSQPVREPYALEPKTRVLVRLGEGAEVPCTVVRVIGQGASNNTYLATSPRGYLALKGARWADGGDAHLKIEEEILAQLSHENLLPLLGSGEDPRGRRVLAYPRCFPNPLLVLSKKDVRKFFPGDPGTRYHPLPPKVALGQGLSLLRAIEHLHGQGFVHHDIKPANLMVLLENDRDAVADSVLLERTLRGTARVVLIDIGGSRSKAYLRELNQGAVDDDVEVVPPQLTPLYAPPEALLPTEGPWGRRPLLMPSLDLYAAALLIYSTLTGRAPYDHLGKPLEDLSMLLTAKDAERAGDLVPISYEAVAGSLGDELLGSQLFTFLSSCLSPKPTDRPVVGDARDFLERLDASYQGASVPEAEIFFGAPTRRDA